LDGGLANNNPIHEVWAEKGHIFLGKEVCCVVSIGTGKSQKEPQKIASILGTGRTLGDILTDTENAHMRFRSNRSTDGMGVEYFRFNPDTGDGDIALDEFKKLGQLEKYTLDYINANQRDIKKCAKRLARVPEHQILIDHERRRRRRRTKSLDRKSILYDAPPLPGVEGGRLDDEGRRPAAATHNL
jgi:hypothetical protein